MTDAAIKFSLAHDEVSSVIVGIMRPSEVAKNINACKRPLLSKADLAAIAKLND